MKYKLFLLFVSFATLVGAQSSFQIGESLYLKEQYQKAKPYFESYLRDYPEDKKTKEYLGDIAGVKKNWDVALEYYKELLDESPYVAEYHFKYGGALGLKSLEISKLKAVFYLDDIKFHLNKATELDPKHIEARWALVELYIQLPSIVGGSEEKALSYANQLQGISPVDGYLAKGYIAEYNNRLKDAEQFYKKAIELGGSAHTYDKLTKLYEHNDQPTQAIENLEDSLRKFDRNQLNYQIGKICAQYNIELQRGLVYLERYIKNHSVKDGVPLDWAYFRKAQIYRNMNDKDKAYNWINKALASRADFKEALVEKKLILQM